MTEFRQRVDSVRPQIAIYAMKIVAPLARVAVIEADFGQGAFEAVLLPAMSHESEYVQALTSILRRLAEEGRLLDPWRS